MLHELAMSYRNDLEASIAQNHALRLELSRRNQELAQLRAESPATPLGRRPALGAGKGLRFKAPPTYFPLATMWRIGMSNAMSWIMDARASSTPMDHAGQWLARRGAAGLLWLARPVGLLIFMLVLAPISIVNLLVHSIVLLPWILARSIRLSNRPRASASGWLDGRPSAQESEFYSLSLTLMPPLCFPGYWIPIFLLA